MAGERAVDLAKEFGVSVRRINRNIRRMMKRRGEEKLAASQTKSCRWAQMSALNFLRWKVMCQACACPLGCLKLWSIFKTIGRSKCRDLSISRPGRDS